MMILLKRQWQVVVKDIDRGSLILFLKNLFQAPLLKIQV